MKSRRFGRWCTGLGLIVSLPFAGGCVQDAQSNASPAVAVSNTVASTPASNSVAAANVSDTNVVPDKPAIDIAEAPYQPISAPKAPPPNIRTNGPIGEIVRMTESGVDEGVLLSFVTNSPSIFGLGADEIIYLNDIGVPSSVVTAMLQHDQGLKAGTGPTFDFQPAPQPPEMANTPAPAEVAPQSTAPPPAPETAQAAPPPPENVSYQAFYDSLNPYGSWVNIDGYGQVWQPTVGVANPTWTPYVNGGHWIYTDSGWYWVSDYSWGWAPFHYGRWFRHYRLGWCWYPDTYWGPSWVTWRYNDGYCGWAPLPPGACYAPGIGMTYWGSHVGVGFSFGLGYDCFTFVSWGHFNDHHLHHYAEHHDHGRQLYHDSVAATRFDGNRRFASNHGLPVDRVTRGTGTEVRKVAIREVSTPAARGVRNERLAGDGRSVAVYRPRLADSPRAQAAEGRSALNRSSTGNASAVSAREVAAPRTAPSSRAATVAATPTTERKAWERPVPATQREGRQPVVATAPKSTPGRVVERATPNNRGTGLSNPELAPQSSTRITGRQPTAQPGRSDLTSRPLGTREVASANVPESQNALAPSPATTRPANSALSRPAAPATSGQSQVQPRATSNWQRDSGASTRNLSSSTIAPRLDSRPTATAPAGSPIQRNPNTSQGTWNRGATTSMNPGQPSALTYQAPTQPSSGRFYSGPATIQETPRYTSPSRMEGLRQTTQPSYQAPAIVETPRSIPTPSTTPSYSAPAPRSYSAPPAASAPSYSAPSQPSRPAPAPAPSSSGGSSSGRSSRTRDN